MLFRGEIWKKYVFFEKNQGRKLSPRWRNPVCFNLENGNFV